MKRSGLALLILILAAAIVLFLFTNQMKKLKATDAPSGESAVWQAQEAVDALNERIRQAYPDE